MKRLLLEMSNRSASGQAAKQTCPQLECWAAPQVRQLPHDMWQADEVQAALAVPAQLAVPVQLQKPMMTNLQSACTQQAPLA